MLTPGDRQRNFKSLWLALAGNKPDISRLLLRQFWRDIDGLAKEHPAVWEVYRRKNTIQHDAGDFFLQMTDPFSPALAEVFPTLVVRVTYECSLCNISKTTGSPQEMRPVVVDIPPLPNTSDNLKLRGLFEFGKWEDIDEDEELRDVCKHDGQGHQRRQTTPQAWPDRLSCRSSALSS